MINLSRAFNRKVLKKLPIVDIAVAVLNNTSNDEILLKDLNTVVAKKKGTSIASVAGTLYGNDINPPPHKLMGREDVTCAWIRVKTSTGGARIVRIGSKKHNPKDQLNLSYDTEGKQEARRKGPEWCLRKFRRKHPRILTMAGSDGYDVKRFLDIKPESLIDNVEQNPNAFKSIKEKGFPITNYFTSMVKYLEKCPKDNYELIFFDSDGYISESLDKSLKSINEKKVTKYLCLTIQNLEKFRNTGSFIIALRKRFAKCKRPTTAYLRSKIMSNYAIIKDFTYSRGQTGMNTKSMRTIVFKLREE